MWRGPESIYQFKFNHIQVTSIRKLLLKLSLSSSLDVLEFDYKLLRLSCDAIVPSLTYLFNMSLQTGCVPTDWKYARVTPIYKGKGEHSDTSNFRPISVLSHIAKILEKEVQCQLVSYLIEHDFITLDQSAYRKFHSTSTCLHTSIDEWLQNIEDKLYTGVCFLDISKCFDTINHLILLDKLSKYGVKSIENLWFKSYLSDRFQIVKYNNKVSQALPINIGVPQGSTLGPLLFMLFVNDLPLHVHNGRCSMFADDTIIYCNDDSIDSLTFKLNACLQHVNQWYKANKLVLNISKSNSMIINSHISADDRDKFKIILDHKDINYVTHVKHLGIILDEELKFNYHVNELIKKISGKLAWLSRLRCIVPYNILELVYKTYILPLFDYACSVWGCTNMNINSLQRLQNRAARIITGNFDIINTRGIDLVKALKWQTINNRVEYFLNVLMYNCIHGTAPAYLCNSVVMSCETHDRSTRSGDTMSVAIPFRKSNVMEKSFIYRASVAWNKLPQKVQNSTSLPCFKVNLKKYYQTQNL